MENQETTPIGQTIDFLLTKIKNKCLNYPVLIGLGSLIFDILDLSKNFYQQSEFEKLPDKENRKITLAVIGATKSGKSTLLNALIGKSILASKSDECTFFSVKIRNNSKFMESGGLEFKKDGESEEVFQNEKTIRDKIVSINEEHRRTKNMCEVWALETFLKAFRQKDCEKLKDYLELIELIDMPGINDNYKNLSEEQKEENKDVLKFQFSKLLEKVHIDGFIFIFDTLHVETIRNLCDSFRKHIMKGVCRGNFLDMIQKGNFLIVANKFECNEHPERKKESKEKIENEFYLNFLKPLKDGFFAKIWRALSSEKKKESMLGFSNSDEFQEKIQKFPIVFVSGKFALESCDFDNFMMKAEKKIEEALNLLLEADSDISPTELENRRAKGKEKAQQEYYKQDYNEDSNFQLLISKLIELFHKIGTEEISKPLKAIENQFLALEQFSVEKQDLDFKSNPIENREKIQDCLISYEKKTKENLQLLKQTGEELLDLSKNAVISFNSLLSLFECFSDIFYKEVSAKVLEIMKSPLSHKFCSNILTWDQLQKNHFESSIMKKMMVSCFLSEDCEESWENAFIDGLKKGSLENIDEMSQFFCHLKKNDLKKNDGQEDRKQNFDILFEELAKFENDFLITLTTRLEKVIKFFENGNGPQEEEKKN